MTREEVMDLFFSCCCGNIPSKADQLCKEYPNDIDLTYKDGQVFAICFAHDYVELLNVLLDFYKETNLQGGDIDSKEYKVAYHTLQYMLEEALDQTEPSQEIKAIIAQYLCDTNDSKSDNMSTAPEEFTYDHDVGLEVEEPRDSGTSEHDSDTTLDLTMDNLKHWSESYARQELAGHMLDLPEEI